ADRAAQKMLDSMIAEQKIEILFIDSISTLCNSGRENEAESWLPIQEWAVGLRRRGVAVVFVHHAGKGGAQRGTSRREDILDTVIHLVHPSDYRPEEDPALKFISRRTGRYGARRCDRLKRGWRSAKERQPGP